MADRIFASIVNQKTVVSVQLQALSLIAAQVATVIEAQVGFTAQIDPDVIDVSI